MQVWDKYVNRKVDDEWEKARHSSQVKIKTWICNVQLLFQEN